MKRTSRRSPAALAAVLAALAALATAVTACSPRPAPSVSGPSGPGPSASSGSYYLALGDSVPFGYANALAATDAAASAYEPNYPSLVARHLGATLANYSCPGESTVSYLVACRWHESGRPLHDDYTGAQGAAALAFLRAHAGHVTLVTVTLIGNDINQYLDSCAQRDDACMNAGAAPVISAYQRRLEAILRDLRRAVPRTAIVVTGAYDADRGGFALADPLISRLNAAARQAAAAVGAAFADPLPDFNPPGPGEAATLCALTRCAADDAHPSPAGHETLSREVIAALGTLPG